jgi:hypothetical protein
MKRDRYLGFCLSAFFCFILLSQPAATAQSLKERNEVLFEQLQKVHGLSSEQLDSVRTLFRESGYIGQGNPAVAKHPTTPDG